MRVSGWMATAVLLGSSTLLWGQTTGTVKDDLFAGTEKFAANASSVTEVDMDPDSLGMVNGRNSDKARRTVLSVVHTYSYDKPGMYNMADVEAFRNKLNTGDWHCSVHVRELKSGESTDVCRKHRTDDLEESAIITVEPKELTFIHTIRRPSTPGKPGGDSFLMMPFGGDFPFTEGMPRSAMSAEMHANAAEMRAEAAINRAEFAAVRPEMLAGMAEMRANMAVSMPLSVYPAMPSEQQLQKLRNLPNQMEMKPPSPPAPPRVFLYRAPAPDTDTQDSQAAGKH